MKRHIALLALLGLLSACGTNSVQDSALGTLADQTPQVLFGTTKDVSFSANASRLNDGVEGAEDDVSWGSPGEWYDASKYPMKATYTLGSTYRLTKLRLHVGNGKASGTELIIRDGTGKELKRVARGEWDSWQEVALSAITDAVTLEFSAPAKRFNISELELYGVPIVKPDPPSGGKTYFDVLGMNYTWFHAEYPKYINEASGRAKAILENTSATIAPSTATVRTTEVAKNARWFLRGSQDYDGATPADRTLEPCLIPTTDPNKVWECRDGYTPRDNLNRIIQLGRAHKGLIFLAPEAPSGRNWPGKSWTAKELGNARQSGYTYADAYLKSLASLDDTMESRFVLAMTNEEWLRTDADGTDRRAAYDAYRRGFVEAHRDHVTAGGLVKIATGARQMENRTFPGAGQLTESIADLPSDVLAYINEVGGYTSVHIHDRYGERGGNETFTKDDPASEAYGIKQMKMMREWLDKEGYTDIKISVGELSFTESKDGVMPTESERRADTKMLENFVREADKYTDGAPVFLYQVDDHWPTPRCLPSGSNVYGKNYYEVDCLIKNYKDESVPYQFKWEGKFTGTNYGTDNDGVYDVVEGLLEFAKTAK